MSQVETCIAAGVDDDIDGSHRHSSAVTRRSWSARAVVTVVRAYQGARSGRPTGCRYLPTCSEYAVEAVDTHGTVRGTVLAARRLARCTPWGDHGIDPVPDRRAP